MVFILSLNNSVDFFKINDDWVINILYIVDMCYNPKEDKTYISVVNSDEPLFCDGREVFDRIVNELEKYNLADRRKILNENGIV